MHSLYFVKIKNKEEAQKRVYELLLDNNFASENNGFYGSSKADWFVIGGRWSGLMTQSLPSYNEAKELIKPLLKKELKKSPDLLDYLYINDHHIQSEETKKEIDRIFTEKTGYPFFRNTYGHTEYGDDFFELTEETLAILQKDYADIEVAFVEDDDNYIDYEGKVSDLGKKHLGEYLVIVDYHN